MDIPRTTVAQINGVEIVLYRGNIIFLEVDAIVNAANSRMLGGGGVDGAIHAAAGREFYEECYVISRNGGCPRGQAKITTGGKLPAKHVIHTVGPVWCNGAEQESQALTNCYQNSILLAEKHTLSSIIFSSISTGVYGYPIAAAAHTSKNAVIDVLAKTKHLKVVGWCLFDQKTFDIYQEAWNTRHE